ncbi:hypothetical protein PILCRDRAFT_566794 [Piloderma croceum F 1598]|uniref:Uncharacterized protein n=1 Tax=Piloderma croceum (strain F 1598) TaxID=765440 RepID=A0A0C3AZF4_PILCF|nr:hypothetical protein PILCRDRAFT_566794 [Piloderma croceum F 1598]
MSEETFKSDRPRRSTRAPLQATGASSAQPKRKLDIAEDDEQEYPDQGPSTNRKKSKVDQMEILLRDPKSALTTMDISVGVLRQLELILQSRPAYSRVLPRA